jgi:hypothetical protein
MYVFVGLIQSFHLFSGVGTGRTTHTHNASVGTVPPRTVRTWNVVTWRWEAATTTVETVTNLDLRVLNSYHLRSCTGFIWVRARSGVPVPVSTEWTYAFPKMWKMSWPAEQILASIKMSPPRTVSVQCPQRNSPVFYTSNLFQQVRASSPGLEAFLLSASTYSGNGLSHWVTIASFKQLNESTNEPSNSKQQSTSWEANSPNAFQENPRILWNPKVQ